MKRQTAITIDAKSRYESNLVSLYGPKPINIFKRLRLSRDLSHEQLAALMYTSKHSLIRLEQGCYENPLPVAVDYWVSNSDVSYMALLDQYEHFQELTRARHHQYFGPTLKFPIMSGADHPLTHFRRFTIIPDVQVSITEVAKSLCLSQATLQWWTTHWRAQKSVPKSFQSVLMEIGYSKYEVLDFVKAYSSWRLTKLGRSKDGAA